MPELALLKDIRYYFQKIVHMLLSILGKILENDEKITERKNGPELHDYDDCGSDVDFWLFLIGGG